MVVISYWTFFDLDSTTFAARDFLQQQILHTTHSKALIMYKIVPIMAR